MASLPSLRFRNATRVERAAPKEPVAPKRFSAQAGDARRRERVMRTLARESNGLDLPAVEKISASQKEDPFQILISTLLSARTQDATTLSASTRLFAKANTPEAIARLRVKQIEK